MRFSRDDILSTGIIGASARPRPKGPSPSEKAATAREEALKALRHWGHLRCADLGQLLWPASRYGEQMAQRLARRLTAQGDIARRVSAMGTPSFVLTRRGAAALEAMGLQSVHGLDLTSIAGATFAHRQLGNCAGLHFIGRGDDAYGEHAILHGLAPVGRRELGERFGKLPDLIVVRREHGAPAAIWCETEMAAKAMGELRRCARLVLMTGRSLDPNGHLPLSRVGFIFDGAHAHATRIRRAFTEEFGHRPPRERDALASRIILFSARIGSRVRWKGLSEERLFPDGC